MKWNKNKAMAVIGGIVALLAIIPIDLFAWWRWDIVDGGNSWSNWFDAFNQFHVKMYYSFPYSINNYDTIYLIVGILVISGGVLMLLGGLSSKWILTVFGILITIFGPLMFLIAQYSNSGITAFVGNNVFFGFTSASGHTETWYLSTGFFLPVGGAIFSFLSLKRNK